MLPAALLLCAACVDGAVVKYTWDLRDWVVDYMRPTWSGEGKAKRQEPFYIAESNRKAAMLVNGVYPGPGIECYENDTVEVTVVNSLMSGATSIHWHGIHPVDEPWMDGAAWVTQAPIAPGRNFTYRFRAWPAGTHYWHSHMDAMQSAKGVRGPIVVKKRDDPVLSRYKYDEERLLVLSDEWQNPDICLKLEGAVPGNDVCSDMDYGSLNGQVGPGDRQESFDKAYPYPLVDVEQGKCYRFRLIAMMSNVENYVFTLAGHNMTLVSLDGVDVEPIMVTTLNMHIGERADVIVCADQDPGYYKMGFKYDYGCSLEKGNFIPPGFHPVKNCAFYGMLHYTGHAENIFTFQAPTMPGSRVAGTGGGAKPKQPSGVGFDLTNPPDWNKTQPIELMPEPEEPDARYHITLGLKGPVYSKASDLPLRKGQWYMDLDERRMPWKRPETPLLHTRGGSCGAEGVPILDIPEEAETVELVLNNLSPNAHNIHMHGLLFQVINVGNFPWCNVNKTGCFIMPEAFGNPCPKEDRDLGDHDAATLSELEFYWGCRYNNRTDRGKQNLATPLRKDSFQLWQRSWAVIRIKATHPGVWLFHCHMEQHLPLGMVMAMNIKPSQQKKIPATVPTEGSCAKWMEKS